MCCDATPLSRLAALPLPHKSGLQSSLVIIYFLKKKPTRYNRILKNILEKYQWEKDLVEPILILLTTLFIL